MASTSLQGAYNRYKITPHKTKRKLRQCVQQVQRDLNAFRKKYFLFETNDTQPGTVKEFLLFNKVTRDNLDADDAAETPPPLNSHGFIKWIETKGSALKWSKQFLDEVKKIATRASSFENFVSQSLGSLKYVYEEHICKYCQSFAHKVTCASIKTPHNYERQIQVWKEQIEKGEQIISKQMAELKRFEKPFFDYLSHYHVVNNLMLNILNNFWQILQPMSRWLVEDDSYIRKLQNDLYVLTKMKSQICEAVRCQQFRVTEARNNFQRRAFATQLLWREMKKLMDELKTLGDQQNELKTSKEMNESEQERKRDELADAETQFNTRTSNSSTFYNILVGLIENRKMDIQRLNLSLNQVSIELSRVLKAKVKCGTKLSVASSNYESSRQAQQGNEEVLQKELKLLMGHKDALKDVHDQMEALQKIKDLKIQVLTVQILFETSSCTGSENNENESLNEVLNLVATQIGIDWICLNQNLPFDPPRNFLTRVRDIENIKKKQISTEEMAFESLQNWKRKSRHCSVPVLTNLLERLDKTDIVMQLKKHSLIK